MTGLWIPGPLPFRPSTVPASWAEEIAAMTDRCRAAGRDPAWLQNEESDKGEGPKDLDLDALYEELGMLALRIGRSDATAANLLARAMDRIGRSMP